MKRILSIVFVSVLSLFSQLNWGVYDAYANGKDEASKTAPCGHRH